VYQRTWLYVCWELCSRDHGDTPVAIRIISNPITITGCSSGYLETRRATTAGWRPGGKENGPRARDGVSVCSNNPSVAAGAAKTRRASDRLHVVFAFSDDAGPGFGC